MTENKVSGRSYRVLADAVNDIWQTYSFWKKAEDVEIDIDSNTTCTLEDVKPFYVLKRSALYAVGDIAYEGTAPSWVMLKCEVAGSTASLVPTTYTDISEAGELITDGTCKFRVYDIRPKTSYSDSDYCIPAMDLAIDIDNRLGDFYFGVSNGNYGVWVGSNDFLQF